jgi:hypothetical protein
MALVAAGAAVPSKSKVEKALDDLQEAIKTEVSPDAPWASLCSSKVRWSQHDVQQMATHFVKHIPQDALLMLVSGTLKPGPLITMDENGPISVADLARGAAWVKPFVMKFPEAVPSGFLIADVLLRVDVLLLGKLLRNDIGSGCC